MRRARPTGPRWARVVHIFSPSLSACRSPYITSFHARSRTPDSRRPNFTPPIFSSFCRGARDASATYVAATLPPPSICVSTHCEILLSRICRNDIFANVDRGGVKSNGNCSTILPSLLDIPRGWIFSFLFFFPLLSPPSFFFSFSPLDSGNTTRCYPH